MVTATQANINAGLAAATAIAPAFGPGATAAVVAINALVTMLATKGSAATMEDFQAAVALDDAAIADDLLAQQEANAKKV